MEPESSPVDGLWADNAQISTSFFALRLFISVLVVFTFSVKIRWRFALITFDVLKRCDDKLDNFFRFNRNKRRLEGVAEQGDGGQQVGRGFISLVIAMFLVFNIILYSSRVFMLVPRICVELPVSWFMAMAVTIFLWPVINAALDGVIWICKQILDSITWSHRSVLLRVYKKSDL